MVSDSISLPFRGSFHLSLTVLCSLSVHGVFSLRGWVLWLPTEWHVPWYSGTTDEEGFRFEYEAFTLFGRIFQNVFLQKSLSRGGQPPLCRPTTPPVQRAALDTLTV